MAKYLFSFTSRSLKICGRIWWNASVWSLALIPWCKVSVQPTSTVISSKDPWAPFPKPSACSAACSPGQMLSDSKKNLFMFSNLVIYVCYFIFIISKLYDSQISTRKRCPTSLATREKQIKTIESIRSHLSNDWNEKQWYHQLLARMPRNWIMRTLLAGCKMAQPLWKQFGGFF